MRVLGVLAAWGVLAVLATMCFALGGSLGYRRGVRDAVAQMRERRTGKAGCRPLPANHLRRRSSGHFRPGARARRARWRPRHAGPRVVGPPRARRSDPRIAAVAASVAAVLLIGVPGTAIGATTAQPGESLYKVRRGLERVRVALATGADSDAEVHVDLAAARLAELRGLTEADVTPDVVADVSGNLRAHAKAASSQLTAVEDPERRSELGARLRQVTSEQVAVVGDIVALDCGATVHAADCAALNQTRNDTVELQRSTDAGVAAAAEGPAPVAQADQDTGGLRVIAEEVHEKPTDAAGGAQAGTQEQPQAEARPKPGATNASDGGEQATSKGAAAGGGAAATSPDRDTTPAPSAEPSPRPSENPSPDPSPTPSPAPAGGADADGQDDAAGDGTDPADIDQQTKDATADTGADSGGQ